MERSCSYKTVREYRQRCHEAGIDFITAPGPNLYHDTLNFESNGSTRMDNPPFWTKDENGKRGKLIQGCTGYYKIAPMRRALAQYLKRKHGVGPGSYRDGFVESWIGFTKDEWHRCSESDVAYIRLRFPLIEAGVTKEGVISGFLKLGKTPPQRSVCVGCFANGLQFFKDMYENSPDDWEKAVEVDDAVAKWKERGITKNEVFVSSSLIRLRDFPAMNFGQQDEDMSEHHCNSGVCFL